MARIKQDVQYVFIHPSWRAGWCWDKVLAVMKAWGREAYAPDGPGHGSRLSEIESVALADFYEALEVNADHRSLLTAYHAPAFLMGSPVSLARSERLLHRSRCCAHTQLLSGRIPATVCRIRPPIPLAAGTAFRRRGPSIPRHLSARPEIGHTPPGPVPPASGRTGAMWSRDQPSLAPVGTRPVSQNRHSAMSSLRASATIITRRIRPRAPAVRSSNHLLSALFG